MILLKDNRTALMNLNHTITALDRIDELIMHYSEDKPDPAYGTLELTVGNHVKVQFDRAIIVGALYAQRQHLTDYLGGLGITA